MNINLSNLIKEKYSDTVTEERKQNIQDTLDKYRDLELYPSTVDYSLTNTEKTVLQCSVAFLTGVWLA